MLVAIGLVICLETLFAYKWWCNTSSTDEGVKTTTARGAGVKLTYMLRWQTSFHLQWKFLSFFLALLPQPFYCCPSSRSSSS